MDDMGVVDPLRLPEPINRIARDTPRLAWGFVALAVLAVARDVLTPPGLHPATAGIALVAAGTRDLVYLFPAVALMHRPAFRAESPWLFWGLVLAAAGRFLLGPPGALGANVTVTATGLSYVGVESSVPSLVALAGLLITAGGWAALGWGFLRRGHRVSSTAAAIVALLASAVVVALAGADLVLTLRQLLSGELAPVAVPIAELGARLVMTLSSAALVWVFLRRVTADHSFTAIAAALWAILFAAGAGLDTVTSGLFGLSPAEALAPFYGGVIFAFYVLPPVLLLVGFATGLADVPTDSPPSATS
jgi:hypothetical protein